MRGNAEASSAQASAPKKVRAPATTHTQSVPRTEGNCPVTSEAWTKMAAPMMVPTTIALAWGRPMARSSAAAGLGP